MCNDFLSKCRTCLNDSNFFHHLFDYVDGNYKIIEMLDGVVPQIDIKCNTMFSTLICQPCVDKLLMGYKFQRLCIETNNRLHELLGIAVFVTEPKLEKALDPLTIHTNLKMKQEIDGDVCCEQEITSDKLEVSIRSANDGDWGPPVSSESEMLAFQCSDCLKCFEKEASLSAHYIVHREIRDDKLVYKDKKIETYTKVGKIDALESENNTRENEPRVCVKEEYEVTPQLFKETMMDELATNGELFNNSTENSDDESGKGSFLKPKSTKDIDFTDTGIADIRKSNSSNRKKRKFPCEVCGRVFDRVFNLKRHSSIHSANDLNIAVIDGDMGEIEKPKSSNRKKRKFPCEVCGRVFDRLFNLKRHSSIHSTNDPNIDLIDMGEKEKPESKSGNFEKKNALLADYKVHREKHDKLVYNDNWVDISTKDPKIDTLEHEDNTTNVPGVCAKKELKITPQILEEPTDEFKQNCELFSNESENSDDNSSKGLFVKPVKSTKDIDFIDTGTAKIKNSRVRYTKKRDYPCEVCGKVFDCIFNLKRHRATLCHNDFTDMSEIEKPKVKSKSLNFPCEVCGRRFSESCMLKRHSSVHSLTRPHECEICKYRFTTENSLKCHLSQHKNGTLNQWKTNSRPDGFKCPDCPRRFEKIASLAGHRQTHTHLNGNYPCTVCLRHFTTIRFLTQHIINKHPEEKKYKCDQCEKTFVSHALLVEHLNRHRGNKNVVCLICEEEFGSTSTLTEHMRTHSGYTNSLNNDKIIHLCPHCGKTFSKRCHLQWHMERHSELKKYQCPECPKRFTCKAYLKKHISRHSDAKPHACDICGSRFKTVNDVRKHKRWHSSEKRFKCDQCSMAFTIAGVLRRHMRTHTGEKPYKCKYCDRAFGDNADLNKHLRTHVGENTYMCDQCPMAFKYHVELKQHQAEHYKMAQKQTQQVSDEVQQHEINDNRNIQTLTNDIQQHLSVLDS